MHTEFLSILFPAGSVRNQTRPFVPLKIHLIMLAPRLSWLGLTGVKKNTQQQQQQQ